VLSTQDITIGAIIAFLVAFIYSYLNGQSSSTNFVSWRSIPQLNDTTSGLLVDNDNVATGGNSTVFNETNWKEMSRTENYILYNTRIREKRRAPSTSQVLSNKTNSRENKMILVALLALFIPIFSIELFFALSRQFICEGGLFGSLGGEMAEKMCSPIIFKR
jgi:multisubunit Na+/H+ antiporter MnhB subunit